MAHLPTSFFNRSPVHWSALHVPTLPLFPATVLKIDHRIGPVPDKAVIPLSVEFGFQFILGFFLYFSPHQPITVFHSVVLQLLHAFSQTNIKNNRKRNSDLTDAKEQSPADIFRCQLESV